MGLMGISLMHHVCIVLLSLGLLSHFNYCNPVAYIVSLLYLYLVHELYVMRLRRKLQYEERKQSNQRRVFSDSETVRWLNHAVERIWPVCMEQIASQKILLPIIPWFLEKYKPWTARKAVVQHLYLGRNAPLFTDMRVIRECSDDDHLVLELGMNFLTAEDMSAILAVKLRKRLGFGMWTKLHITGMHVEGKVLIGVKFLRHWPFLGRLRVCFAEPPYFQMTVKPIFTHGLDVTELPGIAGWLDKLLSSAFEQTLVEPNMLVVDVEKFASPQPENWFSVDEKDPIAFVKIEVVEASDMKPSDLNGLADPYVKGQIGPYRFRTNTQKKTLAPKWHEEFKIPICTWESPNLLVIEVRDKDHFVDDTLGDCTVSINEFRDGQRHDIWLPLQNIKMGRLHLAVTVLENIAKRNNGAKDGETLNKEDVQKSCGSGTALRDSFSSVSSEKSSNMLDNFEAINVEGQQDTGIWVHQPGSEVSQKWEPRKGKGRCLETQIHRAPNISSDIIVPPASGSFNIDSSSSDENNAGKDSGGRVRQGLRKIGSVFRRSPNSEDQSVSLTEAAPSPTANFRAVDEKDICVKFVVEENLSGPSSGKVFKEGSLSPEESSPESTSTNLRVVVGNEQETPGRNMKGMAKNFLKHAEKSAQTIKHALSRKGSRRFRSDISSVAEQDIPAEIDSSDDESLSIPGDERVTVGTNPWPSACGSCSSKEHIARTGSSKHMEPAANSEDKLATIRDEEQEESVDEDMTHPVGVGDGGAESSKPMASEENLEGERR